MKMGFNVSHLIKRWRLRNYDREALVEINELLIKAGRRCAYDLNHAGNDISMLIMRMEDAGLLSEGDRLKDRDKFYLQRSDGWQDIFNPGDDGKNYRHRLHVDIMMLETKVAELERLLKENGVKLPEDDIPF